MLYLIGPSGAGKSTLMRALTARCQRTTATGHPVPHEVLHHPERGVVAIELGLTTGTTRHGGYDRSRYPGTDCLRRDIGPVVRAHLCSLDAPLILGEGSRLGTQAFLLHAQTHTHLTVAHMRLAPHQAMERIHQRGGTQTMGWVRSITTRSERLAAHLDSAGARVVDLPGDLPTPTLADRLHAAVPQLEALT